MTPPAPHIADDRPAIEPMAMYTAREAGDLLKLQDHRSIYDISEEELPRCRVGPNRGRIRYWGADLLCYAKGIPPVDMQTVMDDLKSRISRPGPNVVPLGRAGSETRVL